MSFDFLKNFDISYLFQLFEENNENLFIVGGAVRNSLIGDRLTDIDFCTTSVPYKTIQILKSKNIIYETIGKKFGTITAILNNKKFEITTLREDLYTNSRFPKVRFVKDIKIDSLRRDFTMNALYLNKDGEIYDFVGGIDDINNKVVKFIGDIEISIANDPLRILRYFRFCSEYFYENIDNGTFDICMKNFSKTFTLSKRKFKTEFDKILISKGKNIILDKWKKFDILDSINNFMETDL